MGGTRHQRTELAANVIPVCEQSPRLQHFLQCLRGALAERAMFDQLDMLVMLKDMFFVINDRRDKGVMSCTISRFLN